LRGYYTLGHGARREAEVDAVNETEIENEAIADQAAAKTPPEALSKLRPVNSVYFDRKIETE
jgi:hypothetical protein